MSSNKENGEKINDHRYCSVPGCKSRPKMGLSFHSFPSNANVRKQWQIACRIGKTISRFMVVCSAHFKDEDFFPQRVNQKKKCLKPGVVPSKILSRRSLDSVLLPSQQLNIEARSARAKRRSSCDPSLLILAEQQEHGADVTNEQEHTTEENSTTRLSLSLGQPELTAEEESLLDCSCKNALDNNTESVQQDGQILAAMALLELQNVPIPEEEKNICVEKAVQVCDTSTVGLSLFTLLGSDEELNAFTGIHFSLLQSLCEAVSLFEQGKLTRHLCSVQERIVMTLCKLRLNISFVCLGVLFGVSRQTCSNYFFETIEILPEVLSKAIYWPSKEEILRSLPLCFKEFSQTRIVLDCTEIPVQKPKCLKCRLRLYSHYKGTETIKILMGVAPSGLVTFVSEPYGGRASDKAILNQSGLLDKLSPTVDAVMVDKGFLIEKECAERKLELIRPPFLGQKKQLNCEDAILTRRIASARVHVERAFQRIKVFKILNSRLQCDLVPYIGSIFKIVAALVNLSKPILADKRF